MLMVEAPKLKARAFPPLRPPEEEEVNVTVYCTPVTPGELFGRLVNALLTVCIGTSPRAWAPGAMSDEVETESVPPAPEPLVTP
jgi:hypothetical protein